MGKNVQVRGVGNLQVVVVEGKNFAVKETGRSCLDSCVELLIGEQQVSVIDEDHFFGREVLTGRAVIAIKDLIGCGKQVLWIHVKNLDNINVGEVCLTLRYYDHRSSGDKVSNPFGLKALVASSEASSSRNIKLITEEGVQWRSVEVLKNTEPEELLTPIVLIDERGETYPSLSSSNVKVEHTPKNKIATEKDDSEKAENKILRPRSYACQYKMLTFTGTMVTILMAFIIGNSQKKRPQDQQQVRLGKMGICYA
ncbi:hypothetical protein R1sor_020726 [Riccia sorocarpa]|uniref:Uncharacterized protein n=1 Tax=Riccia sorocarpa TaxID=122646 RepID=A0ABD3GIB9_9MARC